MKGGGWQTPATSSTARPAGVDGVETQRNFTLEERRSEILEHIRKHDVSFISAATGMGKSTLIPSYVIDDDASSIVWQLQPRRLAAKRLAEFVGRQRAWRGFPQDEVGYRVRGDGFSSDSTRLIYMTTGYFLHFMLHHLHTVPTASSQDIRGIPRMRCCTHLFVDEVHEASQEIEMVLLLVKMLGQRQGLPFKVVILSATLDFEVLRNYLAPAAENDPPPPPPPEPDQAWALPAGSELPGNEEHEEFELILSQSDPHCAFLDVAMLIGQEQSEEYPEQDVAESPCWCVTRIQQNGAAYGRVHLGDLLVKVNGESARNMKKGQIKHLLRRQRPLNLLFRSRIAPPARVAEAPLNLSERTPFPVTQYFLDDLPELASLEHITPTPELALTAFHIEKMKMGFGPEVMIVNFAVQLVLTECRTVNDSALAFLPGIVEIEFFQKALEKELAKHSRDMQIVILHSLTLTETCEVRRDEARDCPTVYIASSIAETSLTLPELTIVLDFGLSRSAEYDKALEMEQLVTRMGSRNSAQQRAGRVGRTQPGVVYKMYTRKYFDEMPLSEAWGSNPGDRCLESIVLLLAKTFVPFLDMDIKECLQKLVKPPSEESIQLTLDALEEIDALYPEEQMLTAFGEFAVCVPVLGPRLARLVYCGVLFGVARPAIVLASIHAVCGKAELYTMPPELRRGTAANPTAAAPQGDTVDEAQELLPPPDSTYRVEVPQHVENMGFNLICKKDEDGQVVWEVSRIKEGWQPEAPEEEIAVGDHLLSVNNIAASTLLYGESIIMALSERPLLLEFRRLGDGSNALEESLDSFGPNWTRESLDFMVQAAQQAVQLDGGWLSEPVAALRLFDNFLNKRLQLSRSGKNIFSLQRLRQIDAMCREVSSKLMSHMKESQRLEWKRPNPQGRVRRGDPQSRRMYPVLEYLTCDRLEHIDFGQELSSSCPNFLDSPDPLDGQLETMRLVLCAAFPANFLVGTLKSAQDGKPVNPMAEEKRETTESDEEVAAAAAAAAAPEPQERLQALQLHRCSVTPSELEERIERLLELKPKANQISETAIEIIFSDQREAPRGNRALVNLNSAAVLNMLAFRDPGKRLQLPHVEVSDNWGRGWNYYDNAMAQPITCGELRVDPILEWSLIRKLKYQVKPATRMTPLVRLGPATGLGPPLATAEHQAHRIAISLDLEAVRQQTFGKRGAFKGSRNIRGWLMSLLPNASALDLALLLSMWSKDMMVEDYHTPQKDGKETAVGEIFKSIKIGTGVIVNFPPEAPLYVDDLQELRSLFQEVHLALKTGFTLWERLPSIDLLRQIGERALVQASVTVDPEMTDDPENMKYRHSSMVNVITFDEAEKVAPQRQSRPRQSEGRNAVHDSYCATFPPVEASAASEMLLGDFLWDLPPMETRPQEELQEDGMDLWRGLRETARFRRPLEDNQAEALPLQEDTEEEDEDGWTFD